ncbi:MAG: AAA family ATPase [bacterium]|nr:AAA family ATPase [bacterium]
MILSITGPSGVGKTTLLHNLLKNIPEARPLTSYTTREARPSDEPGEYAYVSHEEFKQIEQSGVFLWEAKTYVNRYGTKKEDIDRALNGGFYVPVLVIDAVKKLHEYARSVGKESQATYMYIFIDDENELRKRFKERGDSAEETEARIQECRDWNAKVAESGVPFIYLQATKKREDILADALARIYPSRTH